MSKYVGLERGKVHDEHISSEYYCGGCGWPVTDHDSYCPECGGAFQESFATERTCTIEYRRGEYVCTACGNAVGDDDPWSENFVNGNAVEMWAYCPSCGAKVIGG